MSGEFVFRRGLFRSARTAWVAVGAYTLLLYATLTLAYDLYIAVYEYLGGATVGLLLWVCLGLATVALLGFVLAALPPTLDRYVALLMTGIALCYMAAQETVPANRIHFFQYMPLAVLVVDALRFHCRSRSIFVWALLIVLLIGAGDECLQGLLPDRRFDAHDVFLNSMAGLLSLSIVGFVVGPEYYPFGRFSRRT